MISRSRIAAWGRIGGRKMASTTGQSSQADPLWVPLLTHFRARGAGLAVDAERMAAQLRAMRPAVRQFLLAGSTGDGWEITLEQFHDIIRLSRQEVFSGGRLLFGVLRPDTDAVIEWARAVERSLGEGMPAGDYAGLAVCPPIMPGASQEAILAHYRAVLAATTSPIAVYQLPQVTQCTIEPETMRSLAAEPRVTMFKDTSGGDVVAQSGLVSGVMMVRGAEGGYVDALRPTGPYDGWLLSTGNVFGRLLRRMLTLHAAGQIVRANEISALMTVMVNALFREAGAVPFGNPFSNANRAADHLLAMGRSWRSKPLPLTASGNRLPFELLEAAEDVIGHLPGISEQGYAAEARA
jgi:4-hydroxy-tetrahydrodipicolinate synthase